MAEDIYIDTPQSSFEPVPGDHIDDSDDTAPPRSTPPHPTSPPSSAGFVGGMDAPVPSYDVADPFSSYSAADERRAKEDTTRNNLAYILVAIFGIVLLGILGPSSWLLLKAQTAEDLQVTSELFEKLASPVLPAITAVVGTVLGFYFGTKSQE